jgi:integrase
MATFEQLPSGNWRAKVRKAGWPSQQQTFDSKKAAQVWATATEAEMNAGTHARSQIAIDTTLADALGWYEREVTPRKKGAVQERKRIARWKREPFAAKALADLMTDDFEKWMDQRLAAGISPTTCRTDLALIGHLFTVCRKRRKIHLPNPIADMELPKAAEGRTRRLVKREDGSLEVDHLLRGCEKGEAWLAPLVLLAIETAARQGELLALHWHEVDLKARTARFAETKAGGSRTIPLSPAAITIFENLCGGTDRVGRIFPHTSNAVIKQFTKATARAGIEGLRFHDLRHEATSRMFEKGLGPLEVAAITGHKTLQMLMRYTHPTTGDLADKLAKAG